MLERAIVSSIEGVLKYDTIIETTPTRSIRKMIAAVSGDFDDELKTILAALRRGRPECDYEIGTADDITLVNHQFLNTTGE